MKLSYILPLVLLLLLLAFYLNALANNSPHKISPAAAKRKRKQKKYDLILDVRTDAERTLVGHLRGDVHLPRDRLESTMPRKYPDRNLRILVYCNTGHRARMAVDTLQMMGYKNSEYITSTYKRLM
jgi:phage shock protein E